MISRVRLRQPMRPVGRREVDADRVRAAAAFANRCDDGFRFLRAASIVDEHLGACLGERQRAGAS
jgi:hypothetical protein